MLVTKCRRIEPNGRIVVIIIVVIGFKWPFKCFVVGFGLLEPIEDLYKFTRLIVVTTPKLTARSDHLIMGEMINNNRILKHEKSHIESKNNKVVL